MKVSAQELGLKPFCKTSPETKENPVFNMKILLLKAYSRYSYEYITKIYSVDIQAYELQWNYNRTPTYGKTGLYTSNKGFVSFETVFYGTSIWVT